MAEVGAAPFKVRESGSVLPRRVAILAGRVQAAESAWLHAAPLELGVHVGPLEANDAAVRGEVAPINDAVQRHKPDPEALRGGAAH